MINPNKNDTFGLNSKVWKQCGLKVVLNNRQGFSHTQISGRYLSSYRKFDFILISHYLQLGKGWRREEKWFTTGENYYNLVSIILYITYCVMYIVTWTSTRNPRNPQNPGFGYPYYYGEMRFRQVEQGLLFIHSLSNFVHIWWFFKNLA